jgi:hypothetical protein
MSAMYKLVMQPSIYYFNNTPYIVQRIAVWTYNFSYYVGLCTEEICLGLLVRDFRKHLKQQFRAIFSCCGKLNIVGITNATTPSNVQQQQWLPTNAVYSA